MQAELGDEWHFDSDDDGEDEQHSGVESEGFLSLEEDSSSDNPPSFPKKKNSLDASPSNNIKQTRRKSKGDRFSPSKTKRKVEEADSGEDDESSSSEDASPPRKPVVVVATRERINLGGGSTTPAKGAPPDPKNKKTKPKKKKEKENDKGKHEKENEKKKEKGKTKGEETKHKSMTSPRRSPLVSPRTKTATTSAKKKRKASRDEGGNSNKDRERRGRREKSSTENSPRSANTTKTTSPRSFSSKKRGTSMSPRNTTTTQKALSPRQEKGQPATKRKTSLGSPRRGPKKHEDDVHCHNALAKQGKPELKTVEEPISTEIFPTKEVATESPEHGSQKSVRQKDTASDEEVEKESPRHTPQQDTTESDGEVESEEDSSSDDEVETPPLKEANVERKEVTHAVKSSPSPRSTSSASSSSSSSEDEDKIEEEGDEDGQDEQKADTKAESDSLKARGSVVEGVGDEKLEEPIDEDTHEVESSSSSSSDGEDEFEGVRKRQEEEETEEENKEQRQAQEEDEETVEDEEKRTSEKEYDQTTTTTEDKQEQERQGEAEDKEEEAVVDSSTEESESISEDEAEETNGLETENDASTEEEEEEEHEKVNKGTEEQDDDEVAEKIKEDEKDDEESEEEEEEEEKEEERERDDETEGEAQGVKEAEPAPVNEEAVDKEPKEEDPNPQRLEESDDDEAPENEEESEDGETEEETEEEATQEKVGEEKEVQVEKEKEESADENKDTSSSSAEKEEEEEAEEAEDEQTEEREKEETEGGSDSEKDFENEDASSSSDEEEVANVNETAVRPEPRSEEVEVPQKEEQQIKEDSEEGDHANDKDKGKESADDKEDKEGREEQANNNGNNAGAIPAPPALPDFSESHEKKSASEELSAALSLEEEEELKRPIPPVQEWADAEGFVVVPYAVLRLIFVHLTPAGLRTASFVQRRWKQTAESNVIWKTFFPPSITDTFDRVHSWKRFYKMTWRRSKIAKEILHTEETYVSSLQTVVDVYLKPLRDENNKQIISPKDLKLVFSEIEVILGYNTMLLADLRQRLARWSVDQRLGDTFGKIMLYLKAYTQYINHFNKALTTLARLKRTSPDFRAFLMYAQNTKKCKGLELNSFLIMPVQRIPRYVMLLEDLTSNTHEQHPDYADLSTSLTKMKELANYVNEKKKEAENIYEVIAIQDKLVGKFETIVMTGRSYVHEGTLVELILALPKHSNASSMRLRKKSQGSAVYNNELVAAKRLEHHCFLFNDMLLIAKKLKPLKKGSMNNLFFQKKAFQKKFQKRSSIALPDSSSSFDPEGDRYEYERQVRLTDETVVLEFPHVQLNASASSSPGESSKWSKHNFQLISDGQSYVFGASSAQEKESWMTELRKTVDLFLLQQQQRVGVALGVSGKRSSVGGVVLHNSLDRIASPSFSMSGSSPGLASPTSSSSSLSSIPLDPRSGPLLPIHAAPLSPSSSASPSPIGGSSILFRSRGSEGSGGGKTRSAPSSPPMQQQQQHLESSQSASSLNRVALRNTLHLSSFSSPALDSDGASEHENKERAERGGEERTQEMEEEPLPSPLSSDRRHHQSPRTPSAPSTTASKRGEEKCPTSSSSSSSFVSTERTKEKKREPKAKKQSSSNNNSDESDQSSGETVLSPGKSRRRSLFSTKLLSRKSSSKGNLGRKRYSTLSSFPSSPKSQEGLNFFEGGEEEAERTKKKSAKKKKAASTTKKKKVKSPKKQQNSEEDDEQNEEENEEESD